MNTDLEREGRACGTACFAHTIEAGTIELRRMLSIDYWMPIYDFAERHEMRASAAPERVYEAIRAADFGRNSLIKLLLGMRALPSLLLNPAKAGEMAKEFVPGPKLTLDRFFQSGFVMLEERRGQEMVIGLTGRFWRPAGGIVRTDPVEFRLPTPRGVAKAAWNFIVRSETDGSCVIATETRIWCPDTDAHRWFRAYWTLIRPFSGWLRRMMLKEIQRTAEAQANGNPREMIL